MQKKTFDYSKSISERHSIILFLVLFFLLGPASFVQGNNFLIWIFSCFVAGCFFSFIYSKFILISVDTIRIQQGVLKVGELCKINYVVKNRSTWLPVFSLTLEEKKVEVKNIFRPLWVMFISPKSSVRITSNITPNCRGKINLNNICISTSFPFGFVRRKIFINQKLELIVHPKTWDVSSYYFDSIFDHLFESNFEKYEGIGQEFFGLRGFSESDSIKDIAWRASAKREELISIDRKNSIGSTIVIVLDLISNSDVKNNEIEYAIELAASFLVKLYERNCTFNLNILGDTSHMLAADSSRLHLNNLLNRLALLEIKKLSDNYDIDYSITKRNILIYSGFLDASKASIDLRISASKWIRSESKILNNKKGKIHEVA